jgi:hypothetical protein
MSIISRILIVPFVAFFFLQPVFAQESLEAVDDAAVLISGILGGGKKGVEAARLITNTEQSAMVEIDFKGFEGKYTVKGLILNKLKKPIEGIVCEPVTLSKPDGTAELKFVFEGGGNYTTTTLETHFVSFVFSKTDGVLSGLDIGGPDMLAETFVYKLTKSWRVGGSEAMVINVKLTPFKSAASIQP